MPTNRRKVTSEDLKNEVLNKIKEYSSKDFPEASRIHDLIMQANPTLSPRLWYGMPGYANTKDSAVLCFFRKDTLISFGITESANIPAVSDSATITPSAWYITDLDKNAEAKIIEVVKKATR